jgi:hypothetical protein
MSKMQSELIATFTPGERDYIRRQLDRFFSTLPTVADGFQLKTWRGGPEAGKPKLPPTAKGLVERGLMRLDTEEHLPRLFFTQTGLAMLRAMMADRRFVDPEKFAHVRQELGLDPTRRGTRPRNDDTVGHLTLAPLLLDSSATGTYCTKADPKFNCRSPVAAVAKEPRPRAQNTDG